MSITDELRKEARGFGSFVYTSQQAEHLIAIADRIDAEHEKAMSRAGQLLADAEQDRDNNYANWQECKQKVLQSNITFNELSAEIDGLRDELSCRIEPPKDANGEPIRVGDEVVCINKRWTVTGLRLTGGFWGICCTIFNEQGGSGTNVYPPDSLTHYKPPTVEDMLYAFLEDWRASTMADGDDIIAKYATKLQLKEDA